MKALQGFALVSCAVIAGTYIQEWAQPAGFDAHRLARAAAYAILFLLQSAMYWLHHCRGNDGPAPPVMH